jgi:hypothetical protein
VQGTATRQWEAGAGQRVLPRLDSLDEALDEIVTPIALG